MSEEKILHGFPPVAHPDITTLILGSMPGKDSLSHNRYYAHKRNCFWQIILDIYTTKNNLDYHEKSQILLNNKVGLWDVINSCIRRSSLDSEIIEPSIIVNDFKSFFQSHPQITRILFNGGKAEQTFKRYVLKQSELSSISYFKLPSTSPANARYNYDYKLEKWKAALTTS